MLSIEYVRISELAQHTWHRNPKEHATDDIIASMKRFGFTAPILFDETSGMMVAGHGRLEAATALFEKREEIAAQLAALVEDGGESEVAQNLQGFNIHGLLIGTKQEDDGEWSLPVVKGLSFANTDAAEAYVIADNKLTEKGGWDMFTLETILQDWSDRDVLNLTGTGFTDEEVAKLISTDNPIPPEDFKHVDIDVETSYQCPSCGYCWSGAKS